MGVVLSVILEASGLLLSFLQNGSATLDLTQSSPGAVNPWNVAGGSFFDFAYSAVASAAKGVTSVELVSLGIVTLMFTPYFRVIAAVFYYSIEKDWRYVAITSFVFVVITVALLAL